MSDLRLSIIIPAYNVGEYIEECVDSILNNGYENIEVVIVDDGSTDATAVIVDKYVSDSRVRVLHQVNQGVSAARNNGIVNATGDYITFVDGDDTIDEGTYGAAMRFFAENPDIKVLQFPTCNRWRSEKEFVKHGDGRIHDDLKDIFTLLLHEDISYSSCNKIYQRSLISDVAFPVGKLHEDMYFIAQLLCDVGQIYLSNEGRYNYRLREGSTTSSELSFKRLSDLLVAYEQIADIANNVAVCKRERRLLLLEICRLVARFYDNYSEEERDDVCALLRRIKLMKSSEILQSIICFEVSLRKNLALYYFWSGRCDKALSKFKNR